MKSLSVRRPSPALVVSIVALVVALGGTSYAAFALPKNSVGAEQLKNRAVTSAKINNGAVTNTKLRDGAVTGSKLNLAGVVAPSAINANHANRADSAGNADTLGGLPGTAYLGSNAVLHTGLVTFVPWEYGAVLLRSGPLSITADCTTNMNVPTTVTATVHANSTEANWLSLGVPQNSFSIVLATDTATLPEQSGIARTFDLETPSGAVLRGQVTIAEAWPNGQHNPGADNCAFDAYSVS